MWVFQYLTNMLVEISNAVPVGWFVFVGALVEEIIAPIPSPLVMTLAGSLAEAGGRTVGFLVVLAFIGATAKTIGSWVLYILSDKAEDILLGKFGKLIGVSHAEVEKMGKIFGSGKREELVIFTLRALPIVPTAPVSLVAGLLKINLKRYLISTFIGLVVRNALYLYLGYSGLTTLEALNDNLEAWETWGYVGISIGLAALVLWFYKNRGKINKRLGIGE